MPDDAVKPVVTTLVCFFHFAREAAGASCAPGIPCALCFEGGCATARADSRRGIAELWLFDN
jgi:hypothetical protein